MERFKEYLGDGAYVEFDGFGVVLSTEDGIQTTNRVVMEPAVLEHFEEWLDRLRSNIDVPEAPACPTCEGSGIESKQTWDSPATNCDDCNGTGKENG